MAVARVLTSASMFLCREARQLSSLVSSLQSSGFCRVSTSVDLLCKDLHEGLYYQRAYNVERFHLLGTSWFHSTPSREIADYVAQPPSQSENDSDQGGITSTKVKRKKLKGKRAVVRWLKFFRWKKKREYERMTAEERMLYKLRKAQKKEERLMETLKKLEPAESSETKHDPEILTPEEHFYYLKMGLKCKNYVPVGRRGIYQGVILNMHLHWKKHQTVQVVVKTFTPEEVKEIAVELARLTGGIVLDIHEGNTIIMYRGKNYVQPPTEIMSPRITLPRKKALDKSKCRDALRAVRKYIPRLERELQLFRAQVADKQENCDIAIDAQQGSQSASFDQRSQRLMEIMERSEEGLVDEREETESEMATESEDLSDIFETDSDSETEKADRPLFLEEFEKFSAMDDREPEDFEEHLRKISSEPRNTKSSVDKEDDDSRDLDEVDRMFIRAASLLKKKRR